MNMITADFTACMADQDISACQATAMQAKPLYITVYLISVFFPAVATVTKSAIFDDAKEKLGQPLDIFVVNSFSSAAQAVCVFLMLPLLSSLRGIPPTQLPEYLAQGE